MLKTRCPSCSKLYAVEAADLRGVRDPQFECSACHTRFMMPYSAAEAEKPTVPQGMASDSGEPLLERKSVKIQWQSMPDFLEEPETSQVSEVEESSTSPSTEVTEPKPVSPTPALNIDAEDQEFISNEFTPCVKCGFRNFRGAEECIKCGVIFDRLGKDGEHQFRVRPQVLKAWEAVMDDYDNLSLHREFVQTCNVHSCLPFAAFRYRSILEVDPGEGVAQRMSEYIVALVQGIGVVSQNQGWSESSLNWGKVFRPLFLVLGFVFAFVHLMTDANTFRYLGVGCLMMAFVFYLWSLWGSYNIRFKF